MSQAGALNSGGGGGGSGVQTLTGNTGGAVSPTANNINVVGSGVISVAGNPGTSTLTISSSAGSNTTNFYAYSSGNISNVTGDGTVYQIIFDSTLVNINSGYDTGTGVFTAPFTGFYMFSYILGLFGITSSHTVGIASLPIANNSTNFSPQNYRINPFSVCDPSAGYLFVSGSVGVHLTANATIFAEIYVNGGAKVVGIYGGGPSFCSFSGALIQ